MWIGLLFNLGIILALLAILYYVETRLQSISAHKGVSLEMFYSVVHRQNDLANRCNKISDFLVDVDKWINAEDTKSIEVAEENLIPVSENEDAYSDSDSDGDSSSVSDNDSDSDGDSDSDSLESYTDDEHPFDDVVKLNERPEPPLEFELPELETPLEIEIPEPEPAEELPSFEADDDETEEDPFAVNDNIKHIITTTLEVEPEHKPEPSLHPTETDFSIVDDSTTDIKKLSLKELKSIAKQRGLTNVSHLSKSELLAKLNGDITIHI